MLLFVKAGKILKHLNQPKQIEALLFGQAGFLEGSFREIYPHQLQAEYKFLKTKYQLQGIRPLEWKFLRMRPANFPTIRMSQLAAFLATHDRIFSHIIHAPDSNTIKQLFRAEASPYWKEHYHFKKAAAVKSATLGKDTINLILINTIAPLLFLYGKKMGEFALFIPNGFHCHFNPMFVSVFCIINGIQFTGFTPLHGQFQPA